MIQFWHSLQWVKLATCESQFKHNKQSLCTRLYLISSKAGYMRTVAGIRLGDRDRVERGGARRHYSEPELLTLWQSEHKGRYRRWYCVGSGYRSRWRIVFCRRLRLLWLARGPRLIDSRWGLLLTSCVKLGVRHSGFPRGNLFTCWLLSVIPFPGSSLQYLGKVWNDKSRKAR